jgi:hypothetical protein
VLNIKNEGSLLTEPSIESSIDIFDLGIPKKEYVSIIEKEKKIIKRTQSLLLIFLIDIKRPKARGKTGIKYLG